MSLRDRVREFILDNPGASAAMVAEALGCSVVSARTHARVEGLRLAHGNMRKPSTAVPLGQQLGPMRAAIDEAMRGPLVVSIIREVVNQWLEAKLPVMVPKDEQVNAMLASPEGVEAIAKALRAQGYAGIFSALHRDNSEIVRRALHTPLELAEKRSNRDADTIGARFAYIMGDPDGATIARAFFSALGERGRKMFGDVVRGIIEKERQGGATDGVQS